MTGITKAPKRIFTLGPEGTFSDKATRRLLEHLRRQHPASAPEILYTRTIPEVLSRTQADGESLGVLPIENSDAGTVVPAQDALGRHQVVIIYELSLQVRFCLLAQGPLAQVKKLFAQPVALEQCNQYVSRNLPGAETSLTHSNTESGHLYLEARAQGHVAAIVPPEFAAEHLSERVAEDIQNYRDNTTRFVVIAPRQGTGAPDFSRHKTSLLVDPGEDRPGLLYDILSVFKRHGVNLTRLESRPART
ncbi:MAG: hypothetical protein OEW39_14625, partial [Deltaproteobacteria bacterium]|nr:hypothetical protein [Deltaproteobacteria bacterium]